jgi:hypothetical protein
MCERSTIEGIHKRMVRLLPQLNITYDDYVLQLDGAPHHFHRNVRVLLNRVDMYRMSEKVCTLFNFYFLDAQCVESGVSCTDCY